MALLLLTSFVLVLFSAAVDEPGVPGVQVAEGRLQHGRLAVDLGYLYHHDHYYYYHY